MPPTVAPGVTPPRPTATICPWPSSIGAPWFAVTEAVPCAFVDVTVAEISWPRSAATGVYVDAVAPAIVAHGVVVAGRVVRGDVRPRERQRVDGDLVEVAGEEARGAARGGAELGRAGDRRQARRGRARAELLAVHEEAHRRAVVGRRHEAPGVQRQAGAER